MLTVEFQPEDDSAHFSIFAEMKSDTPGLARIIACGSAQGRISRLGDEWVVTLGDPKQASEK